MRADYHIHTEFSDDSGYVMEKVVQDAIAMGLDEICFTDHVDYGIKKDWDEPGEMIYRKGGSDEPDEMPLANVHYTTYYETFKEMRALYDDKIELKLGLEFAMQAHTIEKYKKLFARFPCFGTHGFNHPIRQSRHLSTSVNFHQGTISHIQAVHRLQERSMHNLIRVWFLSFSLLPNNQCEAYSLHWYIHQCCFWVDCILQISFSSYHISLSFNQSFVKN